MSPRAELCAFQVGDTSKHFVHRRKAVKQWWKEHRAAKRRLVDHRSRRVHRLSHHGRTGRFVEPCSAGEHESVGRQLSWLGDCVV